MQKDFHFYCIAVLSRFAGFEPKDALTIAYASQYVDDRTRPYNVKYDGGLYKSIRTAHMSVGSFTRKIQREIFVPFHFLPQQFDCRHGNLHVTRPDCAPARKLLNLALSETNPAFRLVRLGIALHSYADTWAHCGFSGLNNKLNDIKELYELENGSWTRIYYDKLPPNIGHLQAGCLPDFPYCIWKYVRVGDNMPVQRENPALFLEAASKVFGVLCDASGNQPMATWSDISTLVQQCFLVTDDITDRCDKWRRTFLKSFDGFDFDYCKLQWRNAAVIPRYRKVARGEEPAQRRKIGYTALDGFSESNWYLFNKAAHLQRDFVLSRLHLPS